MTINHSTEGPIDQPSDNTTLLDVLRSYEEAGFASSFWAEDGGTVRCDTCMSALDGNRVPMHSVRRLEGASDPTEMLLVVATSCPVCGAEGTLVLGYGPMSSSEDAAVLESIPDLRGSRGLPRNAAPDELPDTE